MLNECLIIFKERTVFQEKKKKDFATTVVFIGVNQKPTYEALH